MLEREDFFEDAIWLATSVLGLADRPLCLADVDRAAVDLIAGGEHDGNGHLLPMPPGAVSRILFARDVLRDAFVAGLLEPVAER